MVNKEVIVAVRGGVATVVNQPEGVDVHIRDYDLDGHAPEYLQNAIQFDEDSNGYVFACDCCS